MSEGGRETPGPMQMSPPPSLRNGSALPAIRVLKCRRQQRTRLVFRTILMKTWMHGRFRSVTSYYPCLAMGSDILSGTSGQNPGGFPRDARMERRLFHFQCCIDRGNERLFAERFKQAIHG